jgi:hypothetical protein
MGMTRDQVEAMLRCGLDSRTSLREVGEVKMALRRTSGCMGPIITQSFVVPSDDSEWSEEEEDKRRQTMTYSK